MIPKKFAFITFLTILFFFLGRFMVWTFFAETKLWLRMNSDNLHHYQLGILLLLIAFLFLKKKPKLREYLLAIGSGMIIDESMYIFGFINSEIFNHYHPIGISMGFLVFIVYSLLIFKYKK